MKPEVEPKKTCVADGWWIVSTESESVSLSLFGWKQEETAVRLKTTEEEKEEVMSVAAANETADVVFATFEPDTRLASFCDCWNE